jgi:hypothetical protein
MYPTDSWYYVCNIDALGGSPCEQWHGQAGDEKGLDSKAKVGCVVVRTRRDKAS